MGEEGGDAAAIQRAAEGTAGAGEVEARVREDLKRRGRLGAREDLPAGDLRGLRDAPQVGDLHPLTQIARF